MPILTSDGKQQIYFRVCHRILMGVAFKLNNLDEGCFENFCDVGGWGSKPHSEEGGH